MRSTTTLALVAAVAAVPACRPRRDPNAAVKSDAAVEAPEANDQASDEAAAVAHPPPGSPLARASGFEGLAFDALDTSFLFATTKVKGADGKDKPGELYPKIVLDSGSLAALSIRELWPRTAFAPIFEFARGKDFALAPAPAADSRRAAIAERFNGADGDDGLALADADFRPKKRKIGVSIRNGIETDDPASVISFDGTAATLLDLKTWRVVALRVDPCAVAVRDKCTVELRLIAQPTVPGGARLDAAAHLIFNLGSLDIRKAAFVNPPPQLKRSFKDLVQDLQRIKKLALDGGVNTSGQALDQHPALVKEAATPDVNGPVAKALMQLIDTYSVGGLTTITLTFIPKLDNQLPWVFFQGHVQNGVWEPEPISGKNDAFSIRTSSQASPPDASATTFVPAPLTTPSTSPLARQFEPNGEKLKLDYSLAHKIDNPGRYGAATEKVSVHNTDCASCHSTLRLIAFVRADDASRRFASNPENLPFVYVPAAGITGYTTSNKALGILPFLLRDFGSFGTGQLMTTRTINETAEAARFLNEDVAAGIYGKAFKNPGLTCRSKTLSDPRAVNAALYDCINFFDQGPKATFADCKTKICDAGG